MDILLPIFLSVYLELSVTNLTYSDITAVATRVAKEKQSNHLTPRCAHVTML